MTTPIVLEELARQALSGDRDALDNYILDLKKSPFERQHLSFDAFAENLATGQAAASATNTEQSMLIDEVKVGCSLSSSFETSSEH